MTYQEFNSLIEGETPVLVDFYADWCAPCRVLAPIIEEVQTHYGEKIIVLKIDVERQQHISKHFNIMSIPTLMVFKNGKKRWHVLGVRSKKDIQKVLDKALEITNQSNKKEGFGFFKSIFKKKNNE